MASLSGNKIKDTYNLLLKLESSEVSSSEQVVEDGAGNNTALKLSTDTVETTGELKISGTPSTSTSNTTALMLSTSGVVVTRDLSTNPIGTASITPNLPIVATGSTVGLADPAALSQLTAPASIDKYLIWDESASEYKYIESQDLATTGITSSSPITASAGVIGLDDPVNLNQITTPATDDKYLIWDESASEYKYVDQDDLKTSIGVAQLNMMVAKAAGNQSVSSTATTAVAIFAEIVDDSSATATSVATSSVLFGTLTNSSSARILGLAQTSDPRDSVLVNEKAGWFKITALIYFTSGLGPRDVDFTLYESIGASTLGTLYLKAVQSEFTVATMEAYWYSDGAGGYKLQILGTTNGLGVTVFQGQTSLTVEYLGDNASL